MRIFTPSQLIEQQFPTKEKLTNVYEESKIIIQQMVEEQNLLGATSYGSVPDQIFSVASDIDWIFVFQDYQKMFESKGLQQIIKLHRDNHIEFTPPITTLSTMQSQYNNLFVFHSMNFIKTRFIAGQDPYEIYETSTKHLDYLKVIETYLLNFHKDYIEPILYNLNYSSSFNKYIECLDNSIQAVSQMRRFMILTLINHQGFKLSTDNMDLRYQGVYQGIVPIQILNSERNCDQFQKIYKEYIDDFVLQPINMLSVSNYREFLMQFEEVILKAIEFCTFNLELYQNRFSITLNQSSK